MENKENKEGVKEKEELDADVFDTQKFDGLTIKKIEHAEAELKRIKPNRFNVYAFLLGSLYYLFKFHFKSFLAYFGIWFFFLLIIVAIEIPELAILAVLLIPIGRIYIGFTANKYMYNYYKNYIDRHKNHNMTAEVLYYSISPKKLAILSVLTIGIFPYYWIYRNYRLLETYTKTTLYAFQHSVLALLDIWILFDVMIRNMNKDYYDVETFRKVTMKYNKILTIPTMIFLFFIGGNAMMAAPPIFAGTVGAILYVLIFWSIKVLCQIQKEVLAYNSHIKSEPVKVHSIVDKIVIGLMMAFMTLGMWIITLAFAHNIYKYFNSLPPYN